MARTLARRSAEGSATSGVDRQQDQRLAQGEQFGAGSRVLGQPRFDGRTFGGGQRAEGQFGERVVTGIGTGRGHAWPPPMTGAPSPDGSAARRRSKPRRMRVLIVPSGCSSRSATSVCVRPSWKASSMAARCASGRDSQRRAYARDLVRRQQGDIDGRRHVCRVAQGRVVIALQRWLPAPRAQPIDRPTARHHQQPGDDGAACRVVACRLPPGLGEHVLHDLLGIGLIPQDPDRQREHRAAVPIVDLGQRAAVARGHASHGVGVGVTRLPALPGIQRQRKKHPHQPAHPCLRTGTHSRCDAGIMQGRNLQRKVRPEFRKSAPSTACEFAPSQLSRTRA